MKIRKMKASETLLFFKMSMVHFREGMEILNQNLKGMESGCRWNQRLFGLPMRILARNRTYYFVEENSEIIGGFAISSFNDYFSMSSLTIRKELQGKGLGTKVMQHIVKTYGTKKLKLEVEAKSEPAIKLYTKFNFVELSRYSYFYFNIPLITKNLPSGYSTRLAVKDDLKRLDKIISKVPDMKDLPQSYKNSFNKWQNKFYRKQHQIPAVLLYEGEIVGLGRAIWRKSNIIAQIVARAVIPEAVPAYTAFLSFITQQVSQFQVNQGMFVSNSKQEHFYETMKPYLDQPVITFIQMERIAEN